MKKKQYICPEISVYEIMPTTLLAASPLEKAREEDLNYRLAYKKGNEFLKTLLCGMLIIAIE